MPVGPADKPDPTHFEPTDQDLAFFAQVSSVGLQWLAPDGRILWANRAQLDLMGLEEAEYVGHGISEFVTGDDGVLARLLSGESPVGEVRLRSRSGIKNVLVDAMPLDERGRLLRTAWAVRDVTERRRGQARASFLAAASERLGSSLDHEANLANVVGLAVPEIADLCAVSLIEPDGSLRSAAVYASSAATSEILQEVARRFTHSSNPDSGARAVIRTSRSELSPVVDEATLAGWATGPEHLEMLRRLELCSVIIAPLLARGRTLGALSLGMAGSGRRYGPDDLPMAEDFARRVATAVDNATLYGEAREAYRQAEEASRLKDEFLATLSHELRTPLNAIIGWAHLLRGGQLDTAGTARALETIDRNARIQAQLISDVLDVSRIIRGKLQLEIRLVELPVVIEAALDALRPAADAKGVRIQAALDSDAGLVSGDPNRLQQVFWNLLSNAIRFSPRGGRVQLFLAGTATHVEVRVVDEGAGIPPDFLPHVFERFRQADASTTRKHSGLGLGLAIVRHIVELHGGVVEALSEGEGKGSTFVVKLPLAAGPAEGAPRRFERPRPRATTGEDVVEGPSLAGVRVLVVDDERDSRDLIATVLERQGARVVAVGSAAEALAALTREVPDVLVSDIEMPEQNGYDLLRRVRELPPEQGGRLPAAALTAYASAQDRMKALLSGFQLHVAKPVPPGELVAVVASLAGRTRPA
jgi:signal transduction histidine kinase/ActR/RegA family two-component response regulator